MEKNKRNNLRKFITKILYKPFIRIIPHDLKYKIVSKWQLKYPPYYMVQGGFSVIQIGASGKLCELGRSQPIIYSILVGEHGFVDIFEVLPQNIEGLNEYFKKHRIRNISCHNIGIWKNKDNLEFTAPYRMDTGSLIKETRPQLANKYNTSRRFSVDSIDNLVKKFGIDRVDLINITINGAESEAIEGATETIARSKPIVSMRYPAENEEKVVTLLKNAEYNIYDEYVRLHLLGKKFRILWARPSG